MSEFAAQIRERYPEGLTGVFAVGGTRTTYILEQNRDASDPGYIEDFAEHGRYLMQRYQQLIQMFFGLGGQHMIITAFSFRGFYNRGDEYAELVTNELRRFMNDDLCAFYADNEIDPYFVGVDTLLALPEDTLVHQVGRELIDFQKAWPNRDGRRKLGWEIASIPLYSFWQAYKRMDEGEKAELDAQLAALTNLEEVNRVLYNHFAQAAYGTDIPLPHFYLGTNKSGDLKWRSPLPLALTGGDYMRMFYTPYPTLFITRETLRTILEDLAFGRRFYSAKTDYSGRFTPELAQAEYERVMAMREDPETTLGLSRRVELDG